MHEQSPATATGRRLISRKDGFRRLNVGTTLGHSLINRGLIRAYKMGGKTLIDDESIDAYLGSLPPVPVQVG